MNRKYNLKLDLQFRCNNSTMKFNQFDNNTSDFFVRITNGGNLVDIEKAIVVLATIKPSGKVASQFVEVENGLVYADLKPNMKDEIGTYTAQAMLILEDERVVTDPINYEVEEDKIFSLLNDSAEDTEEFTLLTDMLNRLSTIETSEEQRMINEAERILSEENRKIEEAKRVEAELIRQHEEADRAKYDATRESNENIRKQNESIRLSNETNRIDEEAKRVEEENKRKLAEEERKANYNFMTEDEERRRTEANAHKEAEALRVQAETIRVDEEAKRRTTEQARVSAESTRVGNENTRKANETTRQTNETKRVEAETQRQSRYNSFITDAEANASNFENYTNTAKVKEEERKSNELDRKSQEARRVSNEVERISNENTRKANEKAREKNETSRQYVFENKVDEVDKKIIEINATKDNFVSSVNTKVDNKISEIEVAKSDMTNTVSNKVTEVETRFNALTSKQQQDAEVIDARDGETSLKARLDRDIEKAKQVYVNVEGSHISTDSSSGYAKDLEILGNTIQDASNLADIRSVGDKVEGQELYEIPVLSRGKNLFDANSVIDGTWVNSSTGELTSNRDNYVSDFIKVKPNSNYTVSPHLSGRNYFWFYDENKNYISREVNSTVVTPSGCRYLRIGYSIPSANKPEYLYSMQLEEGTVATPYEPYQEDKLTILSPVQLEKVGYVADRIIEKDGVWGVEKNVKTQVLNGSESGWYGEVKGDYFRSTIQNFNPPSRKANGMCDKLKINSRWDLQEKGIFIDHNLTITLPLSEANSIGTFKQWLKTNLPIIKYEDATPQFIPLPHDQQIKLRTFANKTNISFRCEIEGTIKAQVPKSLGATVNTHTEQISNLNKELDRVKKLEESTVSTVETESDFTTVEATSNGYFEDVKLEGKTLVNRTDIFNKVNPIGEGVHRKTSNSLIVDYSKCGEISKACSLDETNVFKSGQIYTIIIDIIQNTLNQKAEFYPMIWDFATVISGTQFVNVGEIGRKVLVLQANKDYALKLAYASPGQATQGVTGLVEFKDIMVLDGDYTNKELPSYFEGLKSVGDGADEIVVSSVKFNPNMLNPNDFSSIEMLNDGTFKVIGIYSEGKGVEYQLKPNCVYNLKWTRIDGSTKWLKTTVNGEVLAGGNGDFIFTTDCTGKIIFNCGYNSSNDKDMLIKEFCIIEKGRSYAPYTPHQSDKKRLLYHNNETQTWEKPILRQWDSIEKHADGKYYYHQRSGEVVLNGSESSWGKSGVNHDSKDMLRFYVNANAISTPNNVIGQVVSDKFNTNSYDGMFNDNIEGISITQDGKIGIGILKSRLSTQDVEGFKQWLQANNVTVVYQLAQEKVYECTNIDLITYNGETNYIVESGAIAPKSTLKVHSNISNVVSLLQKKVSLLESNITSYMITQNRLMLASRYNADTVSFKVDVASLRNSFEYDNDLYELILNNILVGKDNYNRDYIENLIIFYWMDFVISDEMYLTLFEIIEEQHNPKVIEDEAPLI